MRQRKATPRSKTGCSVCRSRHIKCDEGQPSCEQCISSNRSCQYLVPSQNSKPPRKSKRVPGEIVFSAAHEHDAALVPQSLSKPVAVAIKKGPVHFHFFREVVVKSLLWFHGSELWNRDILQLSESEEFIQHAIIGTARIYRCQSLPPAERAAAVRKASTHYLTSIKQLNRRLDSSLDGKKLALYGCNVYMVFDTLIGQNKRAVNHLRSGLAILREIVLELGSLPPDLEGLAFQLIRTNTLAACYPSYGYGYCEAPIRMPPSPTAFNNHVEAYDGICEIMGFVQYIRRSGCEKDSQPCTLKESPNLKQLLAVAKKLEKVMDDWLLTYTIFEASQLTVGEQDVNSINSATIMTLYHAACIQLATAFNCQEVCYDAFTREFGKIVKLAADNIKNFKDHVSGNFGLVQPLWLVASKCRDYSIRKSAIDCLRDCGGWGRWTGRSMAAAGLWLSEQERIDEHGNALDFIPEERRVHKPEVVTGRQMKQVGVIGILRGTGGKVTYVSATLSVNPGKVYNDQQELKYLLYRRDLYTGAGATKLETR